jgi:hypothetical protein
MSDESSFTASSRCLPDGNFLWAVLPSRGEEPKEELASLIRSIRDGQKTSVRLANVEGNLWNTGTIDGKG